MPINARCRLFIAWPSFPPSAVRKNKLAVEGRKCGSLSSDPWEPGAGPHLQARRRRISYYTGVCLARRAPFGAVPACAVAFHLKPLRISPNIWPHVCPTSGLENEQFACRWLPLNDSKDNIWKSVRTGEISKASLMHSVLNGSVALKDRLGCVRSAELSSKRNCHARYSSMCHYRYNVLKVNFFRRLGCLKRGERERCN